MIPEGSLSLKITNLRIKLILSYSRMTQTLRNWVIISSIGSVTIIYHYLMYVSGSVGFGNELRSVIIKPKWVSNFILWLF